MNEEMICCGCGEVLVDGEDDANFAHRCPESGDVICHDCDSAEWAAWKDEMARLTWLDQQEVLRRDY